MTEKEDRQLKHVCIIRHNYYPEEAHVRKDAETLTAHGYDADVICLKGENEESYENVHEVNVFHPHVHILVSDGSFHENGIFSVSLTVDTKAIEQIFRHKVFKMILSKGRLRKTG